MKIITFDQIKAQLRLQDDIADREKDILEMYGDVAEDTVFSLLNSSFNDVYTKYGKIPSPLCLASLMLVGIMYKERIPVSSVNLSLIPYSIDLLLKPYICLANNTDFHKILFSKDNEFLVDNNNHFLKSR